MIYFIQNLDKKRSLRIVHEVTSPCTYLGPGVFCVLHKFSLFLATAAFFASVEIGLQRHQLFIFPIALVVAENLMLPVARFQLFFGLPTFIP